MKKRKARNRHDYALYATKVAGGPKGIRTLDLSDANRTLSQIGRFLALSGKTEGAFYGWKLFGKHFIEMLGNRVGERASVSESVPRYFLSV